MEKILFDKGRILIEIISYSIVLIFNLNLFYWLIRSGLRAFDFYLGYFNIQMSTQVVFGFILGCSAVILYVSLKGIALFSLAYLTDLSIDDNFIYIKLKSRKKKILLKNIKYEIRIQPIPKLTLGKWLRTLRIRDNRTAHSILYEYLMDPDILLKYLP